MKSKLRNQRGFTIIEVLIVLAIAGLIMLIVFLAVPALQRNSRNTTAKNDVAAALGGISEFQGANNGSMPQSISTSNGTVTYALTTGGNNTTAKVQGSTNVSTVTSAPTSAPAPGTVNILLGKRCDGTASSRAAAAYYAIETSSSTVLQCQDS